MVPACRSCKKSLEESSAKAEAIQSPMLPSALATEAGMAPVVTTSGTTFEADSRFALVAASLTGGATKVVLRFSAFTASWKAVCL